MQMLGQDPRQQLAAQLAGGSTPATPGAAGGTPSATGTGAGTAAPAQPQAYQSPPELMELYSQLLTKQEQAASFDRGVGLIASSLAQEQNRPGIMAAFGGDGTSPDPASMINNIMQLRQSNVAMQQMAARRAALPAIAEQYGLDLETAQYLFDTGKLDSVIAEAEKPNSEIVKNDDNTFYIVDKTSGNLSEPFGVPKKREIELVDDPVTGGKIAVYKDDKTPVGKGNIPGLGANANQEDYNLYVQQSQARGVPANEIMDFNTWDLQSKTAGANKTTVNTGEGDALSKELAKTNAERFDTEYEAATGARDTIDYVNNARSKLDEGIIAGSLLSPVELEGRKMWADIFNMPDEATSTTEAFKASLKEAVLSKIKALGSGTAISDADRRFIEQAVGGDITLTEGAMRQIFDILEKGARSKIARYNADVDELLSSYPDEKDQAKLRRMLRKVEAPAEREVDEDEATLDDLLKQYGGE